MNMLKSSFAAAVVLVCSSTNVHAQAIESVTMTSDPSDVVFTLRADKPLDMPAVRTYDGQVRVRFPSTDAPQSIQVKGDGAAIKLIDVRGGSHDSAVMRLDLGDASKLAVDDVRVESRKHIMVVRIARDLLPPLREPRSEELLDKSAGKVEAPAAVPSAPAAEPKKATLAAPIVLGSKKTVAPGAGKKGAPLNSVMAGPSASSPMPMLIGISAILALAYAALRLMMQKKKGVEKTRAPIDIVAQKRIGPRHQLVIVRAFGREHLLSIQGGNTTLIAASEEIEDSFGAKLALVSREDASIAPEADMLQNVAISQKSESTREARSEMAAGGDLIRSAIAQRLSGAARSSKSEAPTSNDDKALSQAVAGLVRLRREAQL